MLLPGCLDLFALGMLAAYLVVWVRQRPEAARRARWAFTAMGVAGLAAVLTMFRRVYDVR